MATPRVLLMHGTGSTFEHNWQQTGWVDLLADEDREVVVAHLPGHGPDATARDGNDAVEAVLGAIGDGDPVDGVGFSAGAAAVLGAAARRPDRFRRVALIGMGDAAAGLAGAGSTGPSGGDIAAALTASEDPLDGPGRIFRRLVLSAGNDPAAVAAFVSTVQPRPSRDELARLRMPVLVVLGDGDFAAPAAELLATLPDARSVTVRGADHFSTTSNFDCIDAVLEFLRG